MAGTFLRRLRCGVETVLGTHWRDSDVGKKQWQQHSGGDSDVGKKQWLQHTGKDSDVGQERSQQHTGDLDMGRE